MTKPPAPDDQPVPRDERLNPHEGRHCTVCRTALTKDNAHCNNSQCPWCALCLAARQKEGQQ